MLRGKYVRTKETKQKLREKMLGERNPMKRKEVREKSSYSHSGKVQSEELKIKRGIYKQEEENHNWKDSLVGYYGLHMWLYKNLGKPCKCEHCGKDKLFGHNIHWANKSGKYLRILSDWIRLCVKCHMRYDKNR